MNSKAMSLKGRIKNYAKSNNIAAQVVLQNYMFERFLERLSVSEYSEKFVVKGGMLVAAIVGLDTRSTMDLDTTLRNLPLTEKQISTALSSICKIDLKDDVFLKSYRCPLFVKMMYMVDIVLEWTRFMIRLLHRCLLMYLQEILLLRKL